MTFICFYKTTFGEGEDHEEISPEALVDVELSYNATNQLRLIIGANNVFDNYPDEISVLRSQGMPYPLLTPIGYRGGIVYFRAVYNH